MPEGSPKVLFLIQKRSFDAQGSIGSASRPGFGWFEKSLFFLCFSGMPKISKNHLIGCSGARPSRLAGPSVVARGGKKGGVIGDLLSEI